MDPSRALVPQIYTLTTVQVVIGLVWLTGLTSLVAASGTALLTPTWRAIELSERQRGCTSDADLVSEEGLPDLIVIDAPAADRAT